MSDPIIQLYPSSGGTRPLQGVYLDPSLRDEGRATPFIYTNFVASLDGRIALAVAGRKTHEVPKTIANARDWRLFQELAAQADLLVTSARYFRQSLIGESQDNLPVGPAAEFDDLRAWRQRHRLSAQPDVAIFSASLDIPVAAVRGYASRRVIILTGAGSDPNARARLRDETHAEIVECGAGGGVDGGLVRATLDALGYRYVYAIAGSSVLHTLASGAALDRLYLTIANRLLGGMDFDTLAWGPTLTPPLDLPLRALYFDPAAPDGAGQLLASFGR